MLMLYLGLLTSLLARPALMLLARLERWTAPGEDLRCGHGVRLGSGPEIASSGGRPAWRCSTVVGSVPARDVAALRAHLTGDRYEGS